MIAWLVSWWCDRVWPWIFAWFVYDENDEPYEFFPESDR